MNLCYVVTPFLTWLVTGVLKFLINSIKARKLAFSLIGYGGLPSNHSAIVSSMVMLIALREGVSEPAFGVALTLAFIVLLDANSLRGQIGKHAVILNKEIVSVNGTYKVLRERVGHTKVEILAGIVVGALVAYMVNELFV